MEENRSKYQIIRKDAAGCFVESLWDYFCYGQIHLGFYTYNKKLQKGKRITNQVQIFLNEGEFLDLVRKLESGELATSIHRCQNAEQSSIEEWIGGTSAEKLKASGNARPDGMSLSRIAKLIPANNGGVLFVADSGPGEKSGTGIIIPRYGNKPENHVAVKMGFNAFSELVLVTKAHYEAWLAAYYMLHIQGGIHFMNRSSEGYGPKQEEDYSGYFND